MTDDVTLRNIILDTNAEVQPLIESWLRSLEGTGNNDRRLEDYVSAVRSFSAWSEDAGLPVDPMLQSVDQVRRYVAVQLHAGGTVSRESVVRQFGYLQQWFHWLVDEGELEVSPMARLRAPAPQARSCRASADPDV